MNKFEEYIHAHNKSIKLILICCLPIAFSIAIYALLNNINYLVITLPMFGYAIIYVLEHREASQEAYQMQEQELTWLLDRNYCYLNELLYPVIKEYSQELGVHIETINSLKESNNQNRYKLVNNVWLYRFTILRTIESEKIDFNQIRLLMNERIKQEEFFDTPFRIVSIRRTGSRLIIISTFIDSMVTDNIVRNIENQANAEKDNKYLSKKDIDF